MTTRPNAYPKVLQIKKNCCLKMRTSLLFSQPQRDNKKMKYMIPLLIIVGLIFSFNNCAQNTQQQVQNTTPPIAPVAAFLQKDQVIDQLSKAHQNRLEANFCFDSKNYSCIHKQFSQNLQNQKFPPTEECVKLLQGGEICASIETWTYNSKVASELCQNSDDCSDQYEFSEYECSLKLGLEQAGQFPLVVSKEKLVDSIEEVVQACLKLTTTSKENINPDKTQESSL
jgi:hypothetical protein